SLQSARRPVLRRQPFRARSSHSRRYREQQFSALRAESEHGWQQLRRSYRTTGAKFPALRRGSSFGDQIAGAEMSLMTRSIMNRATICRGLGTAMLAMMTSAALAAEPPAPPASSGGLPCDTPMHRQFDFWLGDWQVFD